MDKAELEKVREWADEKLATGDEPPWAWDRYMTLRETLDEILRGMEAVTPLREDSRRPEQPREGHLRLVADNDRQESARSPSGRHRSIPLPM